MAKSDPNVPPGAPSTPPGSPPPDDEDITVEDEDDEDEELEDDEDEDGSEDEEPKQDEPKEDLAKTKERLEGELKKKNADSLRNRRKRREAENKNKELEARIAKLEQGDTPDAAAQLAEQTERADTNYTRWVRSEFATALLSARFTGTRKAAKRLLTPELLGSLEVDEEAGEIENIEDIIDELKEDFPGSFADEDDDEPERTTAVSRLTAADKGGKRAAKKAATPQGKQKFADPTAQQAAHLFSPRQVASAMNSKEG